MAVFSSSVTCLVRCYCIVAVFTPADAKVLCGPGTYHEKMVVVIERCRKLTLCHPTEPTLKRLVGMIAALTTPNASAAELHGMVLAMKSAFQTMRRGRAAGIITTFPASSAQLPAGLYRACYGDDTPTTIAVPNPHGRRHSACELGCAVGHRCMRVPIVVCSFVIAYAYTHLS